METIPSLTRRAETDHSAPFTGLGFGSPVLQGGAFGRAALRWAWLLMLLVWPVFAHGCHSGDHDDELSLPHDLAPRLTEAARP